MLVPQPAEVSGFFETLCGPVAQLHVTRLDSQGTQVAFVEFASVLAADRALSCGGARLKVRAHAAGRFSYRLRCLPVAMHGGGHRTGLALTRVWRCRHCPFESARQRRRLPVMNGAPGLLHRSVVSMGVVNIIGTRRRSGNATSSGDRATGILLETRFAIAL